ncbi:hypothetical protein [Candidatus Hodgkinia cicadicola]|uniref:hypothetical protein n=1 Tax=Candidatus Hodgkinia cicadicola TaxID=573658 RepID=UPI001788BBCA
MIRDNFNLKYSNEWKNSIRKNLDSFDYLWFKKDNKMSRTKGNIMTHNVHCLICNELGTLELYFSGIELNT